MLFDRKSWPAHLPWAAAAGILAVAATLWFVAASVGSATWPGGSSLTGLFFGILGGAIILFEFALWGRKKVRTWRIGKAQTWLRAHIWFGLLTVPILVYHSGLRLGGTLSSILMILLLVVVASGIIGVFLQNYLPRRMLFEVPSETIYSQIPNISKFLHDEADRLVLATCGPEEHKPDEMANLVGSAASLAFLTIGAVRTAGRVQGKVVETRSVIGHVEESEHLRTFFKDVAGPYLLDGAASGSPLATPSRADSYFRDLRTRLDPAAHPAVAALENACSQRRQLDLQSRLHFWLHCWLWIHTPLSTVLVVLMLVHAWTALLYM